MVVFSTAFIAIEHPTVLINDVGELRSDDSLSLTRRHVEAVKRLTIHRDSLGAERMWRNIVNDEGDYAPALYNLSKLNSVQDAEALMYAGKAYNADKQNKWYTENYALMLVRSNRMNEALPVLQQLLLLDNEQPLVYYYLAYIYATRNELNRAIEVLDSAVMRIGINSHLEGMKRHLLVTNHRYAEAIDVSRRIVDEHPYDINAHIDLGETYELINMDSLALASYETAYRLDTTRAETIVQLLEFHTTRGDSHERFKYENKIFAHNDITLDIKEERLYSFMSDVAFYRDNYFSIGGVIQTLIEHYPTHRQFLRTYAHHLYNGGMNDEAIAYFRAHLSDADVTADDYKYAVALDAAVERYDLLEQDVKRGVELFSESMELWNFYFIYMLSEDITEAINVMEQALQYATNDEDRSFALGCIGHCYYDLGDVNTCYKYYKKALKYNPNNADVLNGYAYYLSLSGKNLDKALAMSEQAIELEPNNANYIDTHAWVLHRLGRNQEAKIYMRQALLLSGQTDASLLAHYGDILWALGEKFMAETYWQKAVENGYDEQDMQAHIEEMKLQSNDR